MYGARSNHLVDSDEAFRELTLFRRSKVHPHPPLLVPLQSIFPPLACCIPLSSTCSTHSSSPELRLCDSILIDHSGQGSRLGQGTTPGIADVISRFLPTPSVEITLWSLRGKKCNGRLHKLLYLTPFYHYLHKSNIRRPPSYRTSSLSQKYCSFL